MNKSSTEPHRPRAAIYARISSDRTGEREGVDRQVTDCEGLAGRLGWNVAGVYVDNDVSAASGKRRPEYERMLGDIKAGRIDAIVAWHADRLHRRPTELEEFIALVESHGTLIQTVKAGQIDLSTPAGQMVARMLGSAAKYEVDQTRMRIAASKAKAAAAGEYRGGKRPFGYEPGGMIIRDDEAAMIREATAGIIAGRSLRGIATEWNEAGKLARRERVSKDKDGRVIRDADGNRVVEIVLKEWSALTVREMVLRPRNCAIMAHGVPGRKATLSGSRRYAFEEIGKANWPAVVSEDEWRAVVRILTDPDRLDTDGVRDRKHLGSALYECGGPTGEVDEHGEPVLCGTLMRSGTHGGGRGHYRCRLPGKGHVMVLRDKTDDHVRAEIAKLVRDPRIVAAMTPAAPDLTEDRARRASLVARLDRYDADYRAGDITAKERREFRSETEGNIAAIDAKIAAAVRSATSSDVMSALDPGQAFLDAPLDVQRAVVASVARVVVVPNTRRGAAWTTDRVRILPVAG